MIDRLLNKARILFNSGWIRLAALPRGSRISLSATIYLHPGAELKIGRGVRVDRGCLVSVLPGAVLELKDGCTINPGTFIYCANRVEIGRGTRIAHYCSILDHDYDVGIGGPAFDKPKIAEPVTIGENVWIGAYAIVMKGAEIGDGSVVGAQTMVRKALPPNTKAYCYYNSQLTLRNLTS